MIRVKQIRLVFTYCRQCAEYYKIKNYHIISTKHRKLPIILDTGVNLPETEKKINIACKTQMEEQNQ